MAEAVIVSSIPIGSRLVDCVSVLTPALSRDLKAQGIDGVIRYWETLERAELEGHLLAELGVCVVGYSRKPGWVPLIGDGERDADHMLSKMAMLLMPLVGMNLWCDLEGCAGSVDQCEMYLNEFGATVAQEKGIAGVYVGADQPLNARELYALPNIRAYWRSLSGQIPEPKVGWQMVQLYPSTVVAGVPVDINFAQRDFARRAPQWVRA